MTRKRYLLENYGVHLLFAVLMAIICAIYIVSDGFNWWLFGTACGCLSTGLFIVIVANAKYDKLKENGFIN
jgi:hypothetical protein